MDTSSDDIIDNTDAFLQTLIAASGHMMIKGNKKCGIDKIFQLASRSIFNEISRDFLEKKIRSTYPKRK